jgi:hypothetical protein
MRVADVGQRTLPPKLLTREPPTFTGNTGVGENLPHA